MTRSKGHIMLRLRDLNRPGAYGREREANSINIAFDESRIKISEYI